MGKQAIGYLINLRLYNEGTKWVWISGEAVGVNRANYSN